MKYFCTISYNEQCKLDRTHYLTRKIANRLNRLLFKKHKNIKGYGSVEYTAQGHSHVLLILNVPTKYTDKFELIFNDVVASYNDRFVGWHKPCLTEEGAGHYINKHFESNPITF